MKVSRICFYTVLAGFFFAARLTGRREFFLLFAMLAVVVLYALALNLWTVFAFSYTQEISEKTAVRGTELRLHISVHNGKPFPFNRMRIRMETATPGRSPLLGFTLPPDSRVRYSLPLHCPYRGVYKVGMTTLETSDIFGLLCQRYDMRTLPYYRQRELTIYPHLLELPHLPAHSRDAKLRGAGAAQLQDSGDAYAAPREYRPGDAMARIHWTAFARTRQLLVRQYDRPADSAALLAVDTAADFPGEDALRYADLACECVAALARYNLRRGFVTKVYTANPKRLPTECGTPDQFQRLYRSLASLPFGDGGDLPARLQELARREPPRLACVLAGCWTNVLSEALAALAATGCSVRCLILSPGAPVSPNASHPPGVSIDTVVFGEDVAEALGRSLETGL